MHPTLSRFIFTQLDGLNYQREIPRSKSISSSPVTIRRNNGSRSVNSNFNIGNILNYKPGTCTPCGH